MAKFYIFVQNHGLTPLEKSQFFDFFNFLFLIVFYSLETWPNCTFFTKTVGYCLEGLFLFLKQCLNTFFWLILLRIKLGGNFTSLTKTIEKFQFLVFLSSCFYRIVRPSLFLYRISSSTFFSNTFLFIFLVKK